MGIGAVALITFGFALFLGGSACNKVPDRPIGESGDEAENITGEETAEPEVSFLKVSGKRVVNEFNEDIYLRGMALGNNIWNADWRQDPRIDNWVLSEDDFSEMKARGFNVVRYAMTYKWFEDDNAPYVYREQAFKDLEQRLTWARENGIYVILDMHNAQGGWQDTGKGDALWQNEDNQDRLIALWKEIARRYKDDPIIAGYELLNEPHPPIEGDWQALAGDIAQAIREEDTRHILVVCNTFVTNDNDWSKMPFEPFKIDDTNVLYTAHIYNPTEFTHQGAAWVPIPQGANYPDEVVDFWINKPEYKGGYYAASSGITQDSDWVYLEWKDWIDFSLLEVAAGANLGQILFQSTNEKGKVWIDDIVVKEQLPNGAIQTISLENSTLEFPLIKDLYTNKTDFYPEAYYPSFFNLADTGVGTPQPKLVNTEAVKLDEEQGHNSGRSIRFSGCEKCEASSRLLNNYFLIKPGAKYKIAGWVKGEGMGSLLNGSGNWNVFMVSAFKAQFIVWDKNYLKAQFEFYSDWAGKNNVPFYIGEFGVMPHPYGNDLTWADHSLQIVEELGLHSTYWAWRSSNPGGAAVELISGDEENPNRYIRQGMLDLITGHSRSK